MTVYIGIDWSEQKHDICYVRENGEVLRNLQVKHTMDGFVTLDQGRRELGIQAEECVVGLETAHNLLVDYLWEQGYVQIYVLPPKAVKSAQGRFRQSGAKDDRWDAHLIADMLRTDQHRYTPWQPDSLLTRQIRSCVRMVVQINKELIRNTNRLRAVLLRYYPAALNLFARVDAPILLAFIQTYPTPQAAEALSYEKFCNFVRKHHHTQPKKWPHSYNRLQEPYPPTPAEVVAAYSPQAITLAKNSGCVGRKQSNLAQKALLPL
jgi:transposase